MLERRSALFFNEVIKICGKLQIQTINILYMLFISGEKKALGWGRDLPCYLKPKE